LTGVKKPIPGVTYMPSSDIDYYIREGVFTDQCLIAAFRESFVRNANRIALSEGGRCITYRELDEISDRAAAALHRLGARPGDRALFQVRNCKELFYAFFGCLKTGIIPICTLAAHREHEIGYLGKHAAAKLHFIHADDSRYDMVAFAQKMKSTIPTLEHIVAVRGTDRGAGIHPLEALIEAEDACDSRALVDSIEHDPCQVVLLQLSGGTSGIPKMIPRFNNEYVYTIQSVVDWLGFDQSIVSFTPNPFMHNAPMACYWGPALMLGGEVAVADGPSLADIENTLAARKPTWIALAKVHMLRLKEAGAFNRLSLANVFGFVVTDSAPVLSEMIGAPCLPLYGMTEGFLCHARPDDPPQAIAITVGRPTSRYDILRIVEPNSERDIPEGGIGELLVKGPCTIRGYYDAPERNQEAFTSDGFYRSGDLIRFLRIDGERYLVFEGRVKDVVDRGGEKINCTEVENALILHSCVGAVACVAMPDPLYGERLCAFLVLRENAKAPTLDEIGTFLASYGLAKFKWPERIEFIDDLPMTTSGKISKPILREKIAAILKTEAGVQGEVTRRSEGRR
jgi:2,3-dihydroxybenzoate-AMP ligase